MMRGGEGVEGGGCRKRWRGSGGTTFGTERARLVVQVKKLQYAASRLIAALRVARGFEKVPATFGDFVFFLNTPDFKT